MPGNPTRELIGERFLERVQRRLGVHFGFGFGTISGVIRRSGGIAPGPGHPAAPSAGTVSLYEEPASEGYRYALAIGSLTRPMRFKIPAAPGTYFLRATLPGGVPDCRPTQVTVRAGRTTHVTIPAGCTFK